LIIIGAIIIAIPALGLDYQLKRIWQAQRRRMKGLQMPAAIPLFQKSKKRKVPLTQVRDMVISLQLGTSMQATMSGSLEQTARQFKDKNILGERLARHVDSRLSTSPDSVLMGLVEDFDCPQLAEVLERVRMASEGGLSYTQVLGVSANSIEEDIRSLIEQQIQKAPVRLTIPMVGGVFFPALVLGLLPLMMMAGSRLGG
jgi:hypothetical protein